MKLNNDKLKNVLMLTIPLIVIAALFAAGVGSGIVTIGDLSTDLTPNQNDETIITSATLILDTGDGTIKSYSVFTENNTVYGFLMEAAKIGDFDVKTTYYASFDSTLIDSIDGVTSDMNKGWIYYINGEQGMIGADKQVVNGGDVIEWRFEEYQW